MYHTACSFKVIIGFSMFRDMCNYHHSFGLFLFNNYTLLPLLLFLMFRLPQMWPMGAHSSLFLRSYISPLVFESFLGGMTRCPSLTLYFPCPCSVICQLSKEPLIPFQEWWSQLWSLGVLLPLGFFIM